MKILKKARENLFAILVAVAYIALFILRPNMGTASLKNSAYYIKEMLMIMPVVFILTALLDLWVPKDKIIKYLGKDAKVKGIIFSLILGSISAGPVYAAFPLCVMLHKKGASIRNVVIILSAWAVIKVPMLLNEVKFLGFEFMAIRWVLTVAAIVIFLLTRVLRVHRNAPLTGAEGIAGEVADVVVALAPRGKVFVHGEYWDAVGTAELPAGSRARVVRIEGKVLVVEPLGDAPAPSL